MPLRTLLIGAAVAAALVPGTAVSAEFRLLQVGGQVTKWGDPTLGSGSVITYALANTARNFTGARNCRGIAPMRLRSKAGALPPAAVEGELELALADWTAVADITFRRAETADEADLLIGQQIAPRGRAFTNVMHTSGNGIRWASREASLSVEPSPAPEEDPPHGIASISRAIICLNPEHLWKIGFDGDDEVYDLRYTFVHEIGHALGLDHPGASGTLMSFRYDEALQTLQEGDIAGASVLYGPGGESLATADDR